MIGIYKITNKLNNKSYIGQSVHCGKRLDEHCRGSQFIDEIIQLEGIENFTFEVLMETTKEELSYWEDYYILKYDTMFPNGYNKKWNTSKQIRNSIKISGENDYDVPKESKDFKCNLNSNLNKFDESYSLDDIDYKIYIFCYILSDMTKENNKVISLDSIRESLDIKRTIDNTEIKKRLYILNSVGLIDFDFGYYNIKNQSVEYIKIKNVNSVLIDKHKNMKAQSQFNLKEYLGYIKNITEKQWAVYYYLLLICEYNNKYGVVYKNQLNISNISKRLEIARSTFYTALDALTKYNLVKTYDDYYIVKIPNYYNDISKELLDFFLNMRKEMTIDLFRVFIIIIVAYNHNDNIFTKRKIIQCLGYPDNVPDYYNRIDGYINILVKLNLIRIDNNNNGQTKTYQIKEVLLNNIPKY